MIRIRLIGDIWLRESVALELSPTEPSPDLLIGNLETPVTTAEPVPKAGPHLSGDPAAWESILGSLRPLVLSLANNHAMDFGLDGLVDTLDLCRESGIPAVGAGASLEAATAPARIPAHGRDIAIFARAERQFGAADDRRGGVATLEPALHDRLRVERERGSLVVLSVHGGSEMSPWPSPQWRDQLRSYVDAGAHLVHGHHSHVPQGYERYGEGLIFYGLGNFVADPADWDAYSDALWSIVADCAWDGGWSLTARTAVIEPRTGGSPAVRWSTEEEREEHERYLQHCREALAIPGLLEGLWQETALRLYREHYGEWLRFEERRSPRLRRLLDALRNRPASADQHRLWYHLFACESHRDALATALGVLGGELPDLRSDRTCQTADRLMPWTRVHR